MSNYFELLNAINVNNRTEKKNGLTYLSWAYAWGELKKHYPMSYYTIYEDTRGLNYFTDGRTAYVKTGVTAVIDGEPIEHIEYLPIMDNKNRSIPLNAITSCDVNKTIQRSLTKAVARHGLGLYVYAGEDMPEEDAAAKKSEEQAELDSMFAFQTVVPFGVHQGKTLKAVYDTAPSDIEAIYKEGGDSIKKAIDAIRANNPPTIAKTPDKPLPPKLTEKQQKILDAFEEKFGKCTKGSLAAKKFIDMLAEYGVKKIQDLPENLHDAVLKKIEDGK